jgi:hypothetical protein
MIARWGTETPKRKIGSGEMMKHETETEESSVGDGGFGRRNGRMVVVVTILHCHTIRVRGYTIDDIPRTGTIILHDTFHSNDISADITTLDLLDIARPFLDVILEATQVEVPLCSL